jgi:hypothetical protein
MEEDRKLYKVLVGKPKGKIPLGRTRHRWEHVIRMDLEGTGWVWSGVDSTGSEKGTVADCCEGGDEPSGSGATELAIPRVIIILKLHCYCSVVRCRGLP